jgi:hypothetical protein
LNRSPNVQLAVRLNYFNRGVAPKQRVANLWTEFTAHRSDALIENGKEPQNPNKLVVAATFEMAKT